ncbi:MAG: O-antigen ligase domain-containing protein [Methylocystaceae bacterium]|nr:O-antigen ligase domain-containing protein [Methylocystaceae bacterium]
MRFEISESDLMKAAKIWLAVFVAAFYLLPVDIAKPVWYVLFGLGAVWLLTSKDQLKQLLAANDKTLLALMLFACIRGLVPDAMPDGSTAIYSKHFSNLLLILLFYGSIYAVFNTLHQRQLYLFIVIFACIGLGLNLIAILTDQNGVAAQISRRAVHLGRMVDPNMYGVSLALAILSAIWLFFQSKGLTKYASACAAILLFAGLIYTQSRGALIAFAMPVLFLLVHHYRPQTKLFIWSMFNLGLVSALVGFEDLIAKTLCQWIALPRCSSSSRFEIWVWSYDLLTQHPLLGVGPAFRFDQVQTGQVSPHHILWGTALYFGIPVMLAFVATLYRITKYVEPHAPLISAFLILGCGFMATNLTQPFAFMNWHYLFLWLPLFYYASPLSVQRRFASDDA